ncbi:hypothetical protein THOM_3142 [Trachipleistophora hominis]|uniref:Uncharacterized protein n=1 Tax=Trachipleistophora hominis TaxID=72359 RepID=L7JSB6_TRAHO|nr:hypothetical protein THOM_3142 [Trachipleistophora hominis]
MQFLKLFLTVCAVCCTFVPEGRRGMKSEDGKVGDEKKAIVTSVSMQPRLNELGELLLNKLFRTADNICKNFVNHVIPRMKQEDWNTLKATRVAEDSSTSLIEKLGFRTLNFDVMRTYIHGTKSITRCDLLQIMFTYILYGVDYCFSLQWQAISLKKYFSKIPSANFISLEIDGSDFCHKLEKLFKEANSTIPNNQQTELETWFEEIIMKRPKKVYDFLMKYDDVLEKDDVDYIRVLLILKGVSLDIPKGATIEELVSIIKTNQWQRLSPNNEDTTTKKPKTVKKYIHLVLNGGAKIKDLISIIKTNQWQRFSPNNKDTTTTKPKTPTELIIRAGSEGIINIKDMFEMLKIIKEPGPNNEDTTTTNPETSTKERR